MEINELDFLLLENFTNSDSFFFKNSTFFRAIFLTGFLSRIWYIYVVRLFVNFSYVCQVFSSYEHSSANNYLPRYGNLDRRHWSRSPRHPCTLERMAGAQKIFPAGMMGSLVSVREASFCTYVPLGSHEL